MLFVGDSEVYKYKRGDMHTGGCTIVEKCHVWCCDRGCGLVKCGYAQLGDTGKCMGTCLQV